MHRASEAPHLESCRNASGNISGTSTRLSLPGREEVTRELLGIHGKSKEFERVRTNFKLNCRRALALPAASR